MGEEQKLKSFSVTINENLLIEYQKAVNFLDLNFVIYMKAFQVQTGEKLFKIDKDKIKTICNLRARMKNKVINALSLTQFSFLKSLRTKSL